MEIILLQKVKKIGQIGDVVKVKDGYARNFLFPNNIALKATMANKKYFEETKHEIEANNLKLKTEADNLVSKIENKEIVAIRTAGEGGHLYGSVSTKDIAELLLDEHKVNINKHQIVLDHAIKNIGVYLISLFLHPEVIVKIYVNVARSQEEAKTQMVNFLNLAQGNDAALKKDTKKQAQSVAANTEEEISN